MSISEIELSENEFTNREQFFNLQIYIHKCIVIKIKLLEKKIKLSKNIQKNNKILSYIDSVLETITFILNYMKVNCYLCRKNIKFIKIIFIL